MLSAATRLPSSVIVAAQSLSIVETIVSSTAEGWPGVWIWLLNGLSATSCWGDSGFAQANGRSCVIGGGRLYPRRIPGGNASRAGGQNPRRSPRRNSLERPRASADCVDVIMPKLELFRFALGLLKWGVLLTLNDSPRN